MEKTENGIIVVASLDKIRQVRLPFADYYTATQSDNPSAWLYFV